uniref:PB1 domain-containing protein n=1 Tax=Eutreptiella gymnastica TaxID=73025 RepID=A0A7S4CWV9_9EUGL
MNLMRLKVFFHAAEGEQIRRFSVQKESKLEAIKDRLNEMSGMDNGYQIHYVDPDGDQVLISSQEEWEECLNVLGDPLTLRLHVSEVQRSGKAMPCRRESDSADRGSWWQLKTFADAFDARGKQIPVDMMHTCAVQLMDDGYYHEALQTLQSCEVAGAVGLYNMACCYALMWQQDEAIATLKKSIAKGYKDWEHMQSDEDLASLHSVAQFQQMVQDLKEGKQPTAIPETQVSETSLPPSVPVLHKTVTATVMMQPAEGTRDLSVLAAVEDSVATQQLQEAAAVPAGVNDLDEVHHEYSSTMCSTQAIEKENTSELGTGEQTTELEHTSEMGSGKQETSLVMEQREPSDLSEYSAVSAASRDSLAGYQSDPDDFEVIPGVYYCYSFSTRPAEQPATPLDLPVATMTATAQALVCDAQSGGMSPVQPLTEQLHVEKDEEESGTKKPRDEGCAMQEVGDASKRELKDLVMHPSATPVADQISPDTYKPDPDDLAVVSGGLST